MTPAHDRPRPATPEYASAAPGHAPRAASPSCRSGPDVPDVGALALCQGCREGAHRTWRLRYRLAVELAETTI